MGKKIVLVALAALLVLTLAACGAGNSQEERSVQQIINSKIGSLTFERGLAPLSADVWLMPIGARSDAENAVSWSGGKAVFSYRQGDNKTEYIIDTKNEKVQNGVIEVWVSHNGREAIQAVTDAGTGYLTGEEKTLTPKKFAEKADVKMKADFDKSQGCLTLSYKETYQDVTTEKTYAFFIQGKSLVVHAISDDINGKNGYSQFFCGNAEGLKNPRITSNVFSEEVSISVIDESYFLSAYIDKAKTFGTRVVNVPGSDKSGTVHGLTAYYDLNSAGQTNPLNEVFYVTVSDEFLDCTYLTNGQKSPYRDMLNELVVYDNWMFTNTYSARKYNYTNLVEAYGLKDILLVEHRWQRDTLDISTPAHFPASTQWGSADEFKSYIDTVKAVLGWKLVLHEDYWFMQPSKTNQYWNVEGVENKLAQDADGVLRYGWQQTSYANLSNMMVEYAKLESPQIKQAYDTFGCFLDVNGGVDPSQMNQVTLNANSAESRTLAQVVADNTILFAHQQQVYGGPLITEGAQGIRSFGSAYAGFVDSGSRELTDGHKGRVMVDYELKYIRGLMANQGMGPPARFQTDADEHTYNFDRYNAMALAYGHTGFIGDTHYSTTNLMEELVNAYYTFRAIQPQYLDTSVRVEEISYFDGSGKKMNLDEAVKADYDFTASRLYIRYDNGLELYLNFSDTNWEVSINGHSYLLDRDGYAAENPNEEFIQYSCLVDGVRADCVRSKLYTYVNPRGNTVDFGDGLVANRMMIQAGDFELNASAPVQQDPVNFVDLVGEENGANGLTFYYTDGKTLTPFTERSTEEEGFCHGSDGVLIYPALIKADNYGVAGSSAKEYIVMGYELPDTGVVDLYSWTALQGPTGQHGYRVKLALDSIDNVVGQHDVVGDTQTIGTQTYSLEVTRGQTLYIIYEPLVWANEEWFGYKNHIVYTKLEEA